MKNILLTYDYEVFFVKFGTIENSLLLPTKVLVNKMNKCDMKGTFFIDVLYLHYLQRRGDVVAYKSITDQLRWLVASGHRIELHIHPHWLNSDVGNVDFSRYRLHEFSKEEQSIIFEIGLEILYSVANKEDRNYKVLAYRAGGWCIQPFNKLAETFHEYNIKIDSSVAPGMYLKSASHYFDFRHIPNVEWYRYESDINVMNDCGKFVEIPISTFKTSPFQKLYKRWIGKTQKDKITSYGDGYGINVGKFCLLKKLFEKRAMYSIDGIFDNQNMLTSVYKNNLNTINFISHPKNLTNFSLSFLDALSNEDARFPTICDYYKLYIGE